MKAGKDRLRWAVRAGLGSMAAVGAALGSLPRAASAETWTQTAGGPFNWADAANWTPAVPDAAGAVAEINTAATPFTAAQTINLNASRTVGTLNTGNGTNAFAVTIAPGTLATAALVFNNGAGAAQLNVTGAAADVISAPVTLNGPLAVTHTGTNAAGLTISGVIAGTVNTNGLTKAGAGTLVLSGANTYAGPTIVTAGTLRGTVAASFGAAAGTLTLGGGNLSLFNNTGTNFGRNTTVTATSTVTADRSAAAGTSTTHTLGTLSIGGAGAPALNIARGGNITGTAIGGVTFGATTLTGTATFAPGANTTLTLGAVGQTGTQGLTVNGGATPGTLVLTGAGTYTGPTNIVGGAVQINNATAFGTASPTVALDRDGTAKRIMINGGVTTAYNFDLGLTATGASTTVPGTVGRGLIEQVGTGQARVNGTITVGAGASAGGHFLASNTAGNELVLAGPINAAPGYTGGIAQRDGRVVYAAGGNVTGTLGLTGTALVGATNGVPTALAVALGASGNGTLNLNGFDQAVAGLSFGNGAAANNSLATVSLGGNVLTLNGNAATISTATANVTHLVTAAAGGALNTGAAARTLTVADTLAADDLAVTGAAITGAGVVKEGAGALALQNVNVAGTLSVNAGTLQVGRFNLAGTLSTGALAFGPGATTLNVKVGAGGDTVNGGTVTAGGTTTINVAQAGGALAAGTYNLINYAGASPGLGGFVLGALPGRAVGSLVDTGTAVALNVTGNDTVTWTGANSGAWDVNTTENWKLTSSGAATGFLQGDDLIFDDSGANTTITGAATVNPSRMTFANTAAVPYTIAAGTTIAGTAPLNKSGSGTVTLRNANTFTGPVSVGAGTLVLDTNGGTLTGSSGVTVAAGATLRLSRTNAAPAGTNAIAFDRSIAGAGTVEVNPNDFLAGTVSNSVVLTGNNAGFGGALNLLAPLSATYRINGALPAAYGTAAITVASGAQVLTAANQTYNNSIAISGTGFADSGGNLGALRLEPGSVWAGNVVVAPSGARIGAHNGTGTVSGSISGGNLEVNASNFNNNYTVVLTGANSYGTTTIGGQSTQAGGVPTMRLTIGNGGTTGTLGTGNVTVNGDGANGALGFDRSNGYTLAAGQTITGAGSQITRTFVDVDTLGAGFSDNGSTITLGAAGVGTGGSFRVAQTRANAVANISGTLTAERVVVSSAQTGGTLNIGPGATVAANFLSAAEAANASGTINQSGGTVNVLGQVRVGHFSTNTSVYNMSGGTLTMTGASPLNSPSSAGAGTAGPPPTAGDNNLNATNPAAIVGGGIYLGIDGTGVFNHTGGTVTTNWIVLDNRADTPAGANMPDGVDRYNLSGAASVLNLRSTYGMIARNASAAVSFGGGTVRVDNAGTGTGTGNNITVPLDAPIDAVAGTTTTLDTVNSGNGFTLTRNVTGAGTLNLTGGGTVNLSTAGTQTVGANLTGGNNLVKQGAGTTNLTAGTAGYTGSITVAAGRLNLPNNLAAGVGTVAVADGAALGGEPTTVGTLALGVASGATLFFDPNTPGAITTNTLAVNGANNLLDLTALPAGAGPYTAINYTTRTGTGDFAVANAANYRSPPTITDTGSSIRVDVAAGKNLVWTGATSGAWNINAAANWNDPSDPTQPSPQAFFTADAVTFPEGGANPAITLAGLLAPSSVTVSSATTNYTFTATAGNQIVGSTGLTKTGASTLTLTGPNAYAGPTSVGGGTVAINGANSIGDGGAANTIAISGGGRLSYTAAAALDLGANRSIAVGAGGGSLSYNNAAAATVTVPGNITGTAPLSFHSAAAGAGTFVLTGNNAGYTGNISVDAAAAGQTVLRVGSAAAAPGGGSITLNFPAAGTNGTTTTLDLPGVALPAGVAVNLTSFQSGANSLRSTVSSSGTSSVNGPVTAAGNAVVQFSPAAAATLNLNGNVTAAAGGFTGTFFLRGTGNGTVNGTINLPNGTVTKTDGATWTITSTGNTWASTIIANGGGVRLGANNALATGAPLTIGQNSDAGASLLEMDGFSQQVSGLGWVAGNGNSARGVGNANAAAQSTLTISSGNNFTFGSTTGVTGGVITGNIRLVKAGNGTQTLGGANTYTGTTTVNAGTLNVTGTHAGGGTYTVAAGGTLGGTGTITLLAAAANQVLVQAGGTLSPGTSPGILNILNATPGTGAASTLALAPGSTLRAELNGLAAGTQYDQVNVAGTVSVGGANLVTSIGYPAADQDKFFVVRNDAADAVEGTFATVNGVPLSGPDADGLYSASLPGGLVRVSYAADEATGQLTGGNDIAVVVPEPASAAALAAAAAVGLLRRRRRQRL